MTPPISEPIPWDAGAHHEIGWILFISLVALGTIVNAFQITVHLLIPQMWKLPNAPTILALAIQDGTFDFLCLITCTMSLHANEFPGQTSCLWQGIYAEFLMAWSGLSICSLCYSCYFNIVKGRTLTSKKVAKIQVGLASYCGLLTILGVIYPGSPALNSAGLFCYTRTTSLPEGVIFYIGYVAPMFAGLIYMNWKLETGLEKMRIIMSEFGLKETPRPSQVCLLKDMRIYVGVMLVCYVPILSLSMYSWITGNQQPPFMWIIFGLSGHSNTVINPILYYLLSQKARKALFNQLYSMFPWQCFVTYDLCDTVVPISDQIAYTGYFETMIHTKAGKAALNREAETHYCPELTKFFFEDHPQWVTLCEGEKPHDNKGLYCVKENKDESDMGTRSPAYSSPESTLDMSISHTFIQETIYEGSKAASHDTEISMVPLKMDDERAKRVNKFANYIYKTYIEDHAPLSLNLSDELRQDVVDRLFAGQTEIAASQDHKPRTIFAEVNSVVKELIQNNLAKGAFNCPEVRKGFDTYLRVLDSSRGPL